MIGKHSYARDTNKAIYYFKKSFQLTNNRHSALSMGVIHYNGIGITKNRILAKKWFLRALGQRNKCAAVFAQRSGIAKKDLDFYNKNKLKKITATEARCFKTEKSFLERYNRKNSGPMTQNRASPLLSHEDRHSSIVAILGTCSKDMKSRRANHTATSARVP